MNFRRTRIFFGYIFNKMDNIYSYTKMCISLILNFFTRKRKDTNQVHIISVICDTYDKYMQKHPDTKKTDEDNSNNSNSNNNNSNSNSNKTENPEKEFSKSPEDQDQEDPELVIIELSDIIDENTGRIGEI
jgi:hypothetical protein